MADSKPPRPPGSGGFNDLIDQLRALPDEMREAVQEALSGEGKSPVAGADLLADLMRAQGITPADLARAMPPPPAPAVLIPAAAPPVPPAPVGAVIVPAPPPPIAPVPASAVPPPPPPLAPAAPPAPPPPPPPLGGATPLGGQVPSPYQPLPPLHQVLQNIPLPPTGPPPGGGQQGGQPPPAGGPAPAPGQPQPPPPTPLPPPPPGPKLPSLEDFMRMAAISMPTPISQGFADALQKTQGFKRASEFFGGLAEGLGAPQVAGLVRGVGAAAAGVGMAVGVAEALGNVIIAAHDRAEAAFASNRPFAQVNASIANAMLQTQANDVHRTIAIADRVEATAVGLADAIDRMRDAWVDVGGDVQNIVNRGGTFAAGFVGGAGRGAAPVVDFLEAQLARADPNMDRGEAMGGRLGEAAMATLIDMMLPPGVGLPLREWLKSKGFGAERAGDRFDQNWSRELQAIVGGAHINRNRGLVGPRPRPPAAARPRQGFDAAAVNAALRAGRRDAIDWNQRQGLPGVILP